MERDLQYLGFSLEEIQEELLALAREGKVFACPRLKGRRRVFVSAFEATEKDREFTKVWLKHPHFALDS